MMYRRACLRIKRLSIGFPRIYNMALCTESAYHESPVPFRLILFNNFPRVPSVPVADLGKSIAYRLVWSRMILMLTKPHRSSFFDLNWAMLTAVLCVKLNYWQREGSIL